MDVSRMSADQILTSEVPTGLEYCEDYASIFDVLRLRLQPLGVTKFTYVQVPHVGAFDFQTPIKAQRSLSEDVDVNVINLDGETIRKFTTSVGQDPEGIGYYDPLPIEISTNENGKPTLSLSNSYSADHNCSLYVPIPRDERKRSF